MALEVALMARVGGAKSESDGSGKSWRTWLRLGLGLATVSYGSDSLGLARVRAS